MKYYLLVKNEDSGESLISLHNKTSFSFEELNKYVYSFSNLNEFKKYLFKEGLISSFDVEINVISINRQSLTDSMMNSGKRLNEIREIAFQQKLVESQRPVNDSKVYQESDDIISSANERIKEYAKEFKGICLAQDVKGYFD